jgi:serine/threonine protein phosphatase PrpC
MTSTTQRADLRISLGQCSSPGQHGHNQDFHGAMLPRQPLLRTKGIVVALADGIGSSNVSQVASAAAVRGFMDDYQATSEAWSVRRSAQRVLGATNSWLHAQTMSSDARFDKDRGYVCTFSALVLKGRDVHMLHVGDSRVYRVHPNALEQITQDHRVHLSSAESYLGRALGVSASVEIDYTCMPAEVGDMYLLATDGAYTTLDIADVRAAVSQFPADLDAAAAALVAKAHAKGSDDDATVQLVRIDQLPDNDASYLSAQREKLALPPVLTPRMAFEGFTIVRALHTSPRSHVYLATDNDTGQTVVLKTPSVELSTDTEHLDRMLLEEWIARRLDSPHTLRPFTPRQPRQHLYVALEYVEGHTLTQWMADHPTPELDTVRGIVEQIAKGLQAFHSKEMLHQDLRPENVLIDRNGTVRLIDYGSAHVAGLMEGTTAAKAHAMLGTLQYTAPEYFIGEEGSARSDLFSLAVITYQMLTRQLPYGLGVTQVRGAADLRKLRYNPVRHLRPELPAWLDAVLQKALQPDPSKRQEVVSELVGDLRNPDAQFMRQRGTPLIQRNPVVFWQTTTALLAAAVVVLLALLLRR